jgi:hypothetical protein
LFLKRTEAVGVGQPLSPRLQLPLHAIVEAAKRHCNNTTNTVFGLAQGAKEINREFLDVTFHASINCCKGPSREIKQVKRGAGSIKMAQKSFQSFVLSLN